ncbi:MAG: hypothetical protein ACI82F_003153 [Planctomycetota bacterium]
MRGLIEVSTWFVDAPRAQFASATLFSYDAWL